ncbi:MAG TPA: branched-chain amino acid transaminase [Deltaproteobacteria bacterium]|jgi:branched-chain amino acid aminotransferase|nr:branched-chain amino acid transaminase [Pseudomonadota bacterium]HNU73201.1 branched-chain amino acid transaminase [Deltaproteobacteria bacterium]HON62002.1 branched-chain amino acid transaminase [Deltaproteobacteria bacterium]HRC97358.1 branched-chain amino acid transaminase [Deltaproteobacteria bacterium]
MVDKLKKIWLDGKLIDWDEARVHVLTHSLHYGVAAFEGVRCYACHDGRSAIFRHREHTRRLFNSAKAYLMKIPFTQDEIMDATKQVILANGLKEAYIRPIAFIGDGVMGVNPGTNPVRVSIICWKWGAYLGDEGLDKGIRVKTSSFMRHHQNIMLTQAKVSGNYVNSVLSKMEVLKAGYDEALMLDPQGNAAEGSGENIFCVRGKTLSTPPLTSVLPGITRDTIITLARELGFEVREEHFSRDALYMADEVFFTGTAAEVTPVREIDDRTIGEGRPGEVTRSLQKAFFDVVKGRDKKHADWLDYLDAPAQKKVSAGQAG